MSEHATATNDDPDPPYRDGFICGSGLEDPENARWTHEVYDTRDEAIAYAKEHGKLQTATIRCEKRFMPNPLSAEDACDGAENEEFGAGMLETWLDNVFDPKRKLIDELQATLDQVWSDFEAKHKLWVWGFWFDDVELVPVDVVAAVPAEAT